MLKDPKLPMTPGTIADDVSNTRPQSGHCKPLLYSRLMESSSFPLLANTGEQLFFSVAN